jgi:hypothetical protein
MPLDLFGPASAPGAVTSRPGDSRAFTATDTFFKDCSSPTLDDGTEFQAAWFNQMLAVARGLARGNGQTAGAVNIVTEDNTDDSILLKSMQHLIQRGQTTYAADSGSADAMVAALSPALAEYKTGMTIWLKKGNSANLTTTPTANINGLGVKTITRRDGTPLAKRDLPANAWLPYSYDGTNLRVIVPVISEFIPIGNPTLYVRTDGNDNNDGSANDSAHAFATIQAAIDYSAQVRGIGGRVLNIQLGNAGTYTGFVSVQNPVTSCVITGDVANQASYVITPPGVGGSVSQIVYAGGSALALKGVTVTTARADLNFISASYAGSISLDRVTITAAATTTLFAMIGVSGGSITVAGNVTINGNFGAALGAVGGGSVTTQAGATVTINASTFSVATLVAQICGTIQIIGAWGGTATGVRANAILNGVCFISGVNPPGSSAPTTATGGQVA